MEQILLVSSEFVKNVTNISDNVPGKLIQPAIFEAQNEGLRGILGDKLEDKLESLVDTGDIDLPANADYKTLLIKCQYFLAYTTVANVCMLTTVKIDGAGLEQVSDEKMESLTISESYQIQAFYQHKADYLCRQLQNYLLQNYTKYTELNQWDIHSIKRNLISSATTGIWLGGPRNRYHKPGWNWWSKYCRDGYGK